MREYYYFKGKRKYLIMFVVFFDYRWGKEEQKKSSIKGGCRSVYLYLERKMLLQVVCFRQFVLRWMGGEVISFFRI